MIGLVVGRIGVGHTLGQKYPGSALEQEVGRYAAERFQAAHVEDFQKYFHRVRLQLGDKTTDNPNEKVPVPIREEEAQRILGVQDENAVSAAETEVNFSLGESVKITDGPFSGFSGTVDEILQDRSKLKVIVVIFGRKTLLELSFTQVTKE